jgi:hypothetical protein
MVRKYALDFDPDERGFRLQAEGMRTDLPAKAGSHEKG